MRMRDDGKASGIRVFAAPGTNLLIVTRRQLQIIQQDLWILLVLLAITILSESEKLTPLTMQYPTRNFVESSVTPRASINPNLPLGTKELIIPPSALITGATISFNHFLPGTLDEQRLRDSIAILASIIPTLGARFRSIPRDDDHPHGKFWFDLTSSPIPFETQDCDFDEPFPDTRDTVVQPSSTEAFLPQLEMFTTTSPNTDAPLCAFRLTRFASGKSNLGFKLAHVLGDAFSHCCFVQLLSETYSAGEDYKPTAFPTFNNGHRDILNSPPHPSLNDIPFILNSPIFTDVKALQDIPADMDRKGMTQPMKDVCVRLSRAELQHLKSGCMEDLHRRGDTTAYLSSLDVISGLLTSWSGRGMNEKVEILSYIVNVRAIGAHPSNYIGDGVLPLELDISSTLSFADPIEHIASVGSIIRAAINKIKSDKAFVDEWIRIAGGLLTAAGLEGKMTNYFCDTGRLMVNSYTSFDYACTFGFPPEGCKVYTAGNILRLPRINMANRRSGAGYSEEDDRGVELSFARRASTKR